MSLQISPPFNSTVHGTGGPVVVVVSSFVVVAVVVDFVSEVETVHEPEMQLRPDAQRPI